MTSTAARPAPRRLVPGETESTRALYILPRGEADGAVNMATDEAMMSVARSGLSLLRFYGWSPHCLSLGRNQPAPSLVLDKRRTELRIGIEAVRRPTGGRSVYHGPEITYAFACPDRAWGGPRTLYHRICAALSDGLGSLGIPLDETRRPDGRSERADLGPSLASCFRDPAPGELTVGGRKLVGSAQWRCGGALLQHGSILLQNRQDLGDLEPRVSAEARAEVDPAAIALDEILGGALDPDRLVARLARSFSNAFSTPGSGVPLPTETARSPARIEQSVAREATTLEARYRSADWFWRRKT